MMDIENMPETFIVTYMPERGSHGLYIMKEDRITGKRYVAKPVKLEFEEIRRDGLSLGPTVEIPNFEHLTQVIYEEAERKGIKKEGEELLKGRMVTMENHLNDMRKIVGKQLDITL